MEEPSFLDLSLFNIFPSPFFPDSSEMIRHYFGLWLTKLQELFVWHAGHRIILKNRKQKKLTRSLYLICCVYYRRHWSHIWSLFRCKFPPSRGRMIFAFLHCASVQSWKLRICPSREHTGSKKGKLSDLNDFWGEYLLMTDTDLHCWVHLRWQTA